MVVGAHAAAGRVQQVAELKEGDYLGERALLDNAPRAATVTAITAAVCLYWSAESFYKLFTKKQLNIQFAKRVAISAEAMGSAQTFSAPSNAIREKTTEQKALIRKAIEENVLFRGLHEDHANRVIEEMYRVEFKVGDIPIRQGDRGDRLYVIESGHFDVRVAKDGKERVVAKRGKGTMVGELALMYNAPRAATIVAMSTAVTWVVDRFTFRRVLKNISEKQLRRYRDFLKKEDSDQKRAATVTATQKCRLLKLNRNAVFLLLGPVEDIMKKRVKGYEEVTSKKDDNEDPLSPAYKESSSGLVRSSK
eukprot:jgi/Bigna1/89125/estExt_fgenesh1_pg.C_440044